MKIIANKQVEHQPSTCHECPFWEGYQGSDLAPHDKRGFCVFREKYKGYWDDVPKVCEKLFNKIFASDQEVWEVLE